MKHMKTKPKQPFEQVDGLSLMDGFSDDRSSRWVERTEGFIWGLCGAAVVVVVVLAVVGVVV